MGLYTAPLLNSYQNMKRLLILGGTGGAEKLATQLRAIARSKTTSIPELEVIVSLAGRTRAPLQSSDRVGGFGGVAGLQDYLQTMNIDLLIDATHPFAAQISHHAAVAAAEVGIPRLMLVRPPWEKVEGDRWIEVDSNAYAAQILPTVAQRIFLTIGRQELAVYSYLPALWFLMRMIDPPLSNTPIPPGEILLDRGPFDLSQERSLLRQYQIGAIVSKNSGGEATYSKILAARELGLPVVMVQRPPVPDSEKVSSVAEAIDWCAMAL